MLPQFRSECIHHGCQNAPINKNSCRDRGCNKRSHDASVNRNWQHRSTTWNRFLHGIFLGHLKDYPGATLDFHPYLYGFYIASEFSKLAPALNKVFPFSLPHLLKHRESTLFNLQGLSSMSQLHTNCHPSDMKLHRATEEQSSKHSTV